MLDESDGGSVIPRLGGIALVTFAMVVFAGVFYQRSESSGRPSADSSTWSPGTEAGRVPSLLTSDPLHEAYRAYHELVHLDGIPCSAKDSRRCLAKACEGPRPSGAGSLTPPRLPVNGATLVLAVALPGGPWPNDTERRMRERHAVLAALFQQDYHADEDRILQYFEVSELAGPVESGAIGRRWIVPYEWFSSDAAKPRYGDVLVLWLDSDVLGERPLARLELALEAIADRAGEGWADCVVRVVGPKDTDGLLALHRERKSGPVGEGLLVCSPYATIPPARLVELLDFDPDEIAWAPVKRTIGTDDELAKLLVREIALRIPELMAPNCLSRAAWYVAVPWFVLRWTFLVPNPVLLTEAEREASKVRVGIVAELDTGYGRSWHQNMVIARDALIAGMPTLSKLEFERIGYVGRLDGKGLEEPEKDAQRWGYPVGSGQVDYLHRLENDLVLRPPYQAIGVFGSDKYDTLLILETLHTRFPGTLFFVIDLDARLLQAEHLPYTRNVVVASQLPLGPPAPHRTFRDLYQHSVFRTVQAILSCAPVELPDTLASLGANDGHVFEIGNGVAVELGVRADGTPTNALRADPSALLVDLAGPLVAPNVAHAATTPGSPSSRQRAISAYRFAVAVAFVACLLWLVGRSPVETSRAKPGRRAGFARLVLYSFIAGAVSLVVLVALAMLVGEARPVEPVALLSGVSAWPAIAIRFATTVFSIGGIVVIVHRLREAHARIGLQFLLFEPDDASRKARTLSLRWLLGRDRTPAGEASAAAMWYGVRTWIDAQGARALRTTIFVLACWYGIGGFYLTPVQAPVRGELAFLLERISVLSSVWSYLALVGVVLEVFFLCSRLIVRISEPESLSFSRLVLRTERRRSGLLRRQADRRLRMGLIAAITREIEGLVYLPMIAVVLMIAARASLFDLWSWPLPLIGTFVLFFVLLLLCEVSMRRMARREKRRALEFIQGEALRFATFDPLAKRLELVRKEFDGLRGGAFSPIFEHALIRSAALPLLAYATSLWLDGSVLPALTGRS